MFFPTALRDGNSGLINAQHLDRTETEGGNVTVACSFHFRGGRKLFCKGKCEDKILVETTGDSEQTGRYSIQYVEGYYPARYTVLYVNITNLTKSDAGPYQCGLDRYLHDSYQDFEIRVTDGVVLYVGLILLVMFIVLSVALLIFCRKRARKG
ncbi:hypothetical protein KUCAC02_034147 [Chaenocephalus aceratus]|nr:hypothetical protein KUCAC02_034147 [Chaenocephalus aceratus]